ncbi:hypothetical protein [Hyphococcus sp.]|uniref:hypothetical protein n=1 Tax=Hyphococcus sp. TaxID=2038636 RepID=UPI003CCC0888
MGLFASPSRLGSIRNWVCVSLGVFSVHSCATTTAPPLTAQDLLASPYVYSAGDAFDVDRFLAAFPDWMTTSYGQASFDPVRGAMVVEDFQLGFQAAPGAGFRADRAIIWGGNAEIMEAVFAGVANNAAKALLFDRLMLEGVRSEGMQWDAGAESTGISVDKMVFDGVSARSFNLAPRAGVGEETKILRSVAAILGSFSFDGAALSNFGLQLANSRGEKVEFNVGEVFARDYNSGAIGFQSARNITSFIQGAGSEPIEISGVAGIENAPSPYAKILNRPPSEAVSEILRRPTAILAAAAGGQATAYEIDYADTRSADISGALAWLARWELPPVTETDLIDLGAQTMLGYTEFWDGNLVYSIDRSEVQAADFYWLVPSQYDVTYSGMRYELASMLNAMESRMGPGFSTEAAPQLQQFRDVLAALGIQSVTGGSAFSWNWNGETGDALAATHVDLNDLAQNDIGFEIAGPTLAEWEVMARKDTPVSIAAKNIALYRFNYSLGDRGLLEKAFAYAAQEQGGGTGPELRQSIAAMARLSGAQAAQANPRAANYAEAIADFIATGGRIDIIAAPSDPVDLFTLQSVANTAPQTLPDVLDLTITHTSE